MVSLTDKFGFPEQKCQGVKLKTQNLVKNDLIFLVMRTAYKFSLIMRPLFPKLLQIAKPLEIIRLTLEVKMMTKNKHKLSRSY
jgi:hypothetical protein